MLNIDSIQNGIVIDHIQAGKGMRIYELLELGKLDCCVAIIISTCSALSTTTSRSAPSATACS